METAIRKGKHVLSYFQLFELQWMEWELEHH